ncbi:MFS transporter [Reichenbachiella carrageenanivorans]|uniref:MFS transporter n=1 Tax=Reichenbachiella carrageenanivorans TaxID=2979869 RepID=A0ABY6CYT4_9BACT|nr:MFS transporter [Reichenbachiella carrageenanivorans]UXX79079.1 MFS transporter [Reichenbachiella carrageenanivorans]
MSYFPVRYKLVISTFSLTLLLYIDRVGISAAKGFIGKDLGLSDPQLGWVMSAFALGYALFQVPAGLMSDKYGPRRVIAWIVSVWSFFTLATGLAWNFVTMLIVRFLFGAGEAGAFPGISRANLTWIPLRERGVVTGINFSGSRLGAAFAFPLITWVIASFGWRWSFYLMGGIGLVWAYFWYEWFRDMPEEHAGVSEAEKKMIVEQRQAIDQIQVKSLPISTLLKSTNLWLAMAQYFSSNFIFFFCLTWMLPYLAERFQVTALEASVYSMFPLICGAFGNWFSGWLVDRIYKSGHWRRSRSIPAIIGFVLVGIGVLVILSSSSIVIAVAGLSVAVFGADMTLSPSWSFCMDVGKANAGAVSGAMNMAGNVGSFVTAILFPYLIKWTGTADTFFIISGVFVAIAILAWLLMNPSKSILNEKI